MGNWRRNETVMKVLHRGNIRSNGHRNYCVGPHKQRGINKLEQTSAGMRASQDEDVTLCKFTNHGNYINGSRSDVDAYFR